MTGSATMNGSQKHNKIYAGNWFSTGMIVEAAALLLALVVLYICFKSGSLAPVAPYVFWMNIVPLIALICFFLLCGRNVLLTWIDFTPEAMIVHTFLKKTVIFPYDSVRECCIGYYFHGTVIPRLGTKVGFAFFTEEEFDGQYRDRMNLWRPKCVHVKIALTRKKFERIVNLVPKNLAVVIAGEYSRYLS